MPRTIQQSKVTFVIREDMIAQAQAESEASTLNVAELLRRSIDLYLTQFPPPDQYQTGELLGEITVQDPETGAPYTTYPPNRKYPTHINDGLLGELDRYASIMGQSPDEVVNRAILLYVASVKARREAAEAFDLPPPYREDDDPAEAAGDPSQADPEGISAEAEGEYIPQEGEEGYDPSDPRNFEATYEGDETPYPRSEYV